MNPASASADSESDSADDINDEIIEAEEISQQPNRALSQGGQPRPQLHRLASDSADSESSPVDVNSSDNDADADADGDDDEQMSDSESHTILEQAEPQLPAAQPPRSSGRVLTGPAAGAAQRHERRAQADAERMDAELKAIEDALANAALAKASTILSASASSGAASSTVTASSAPASSNSESACSAASGMHQLEQQTPKSYKDVLLSKRRAE